MSLREEHFDDPETRRGVAAALDGLAILGPEAQGDIDETLLRGNLSMTPLERLRAASEAASQIEVLREAMKAAGHA